MYIKRICYPVKTLGPGNRIGIWVTGCEKNCFGCMSPDLRIKEDGSDISVSKLMHMFQAVEKPIAGFTISGGEPFLQEEELCKLITEIVNNFSDDIIIYTGYTLHELELKKSVHINRILELISVLIDGEYVDSLNDGKGLRGSSNQVVRIFKNHARYRRLSSQKRKIQSFTYAGKNLLIGIQ